MKLSSSIYLISLLFITFTFAEDLPEGGDEDQLKITQSFTKHFDEDADFQSRLFWGSFWRNKASASIQRLKEALDRLSENIRELTDKRFFFKGSKQSEDFEVLHDGEDGTNKNIIPSAGVGTSPTAGVNPVDNSVQSILRGAEDSVDAGDVKRIGQAPDEEFEQKDDKIDSKKEEASFTKGETEESEKRKKEEMEVKKEMEEEEKKQEEEKEEIQKEEVPEIKKEEMKEMQKEVKEKKKEMKEEVPEKKKEMQKEVQEKKKEMQKEEIAEKEKEEEKEEISFKGEGNYKAEKSDKVKEEKKEEKKEEEKKVENKY